MASIEKRISMDRATGRPVTVWQARWRDPAGKQRKLTFSKQSDARRHIAAAEADIARGTYVDAAAGRITFETYAERWRAAQVHRPSTVAHVETMLRRHAYPVLGGRPIAAVQPSEVQAWVKGVSTTLAPATVGVVHGLVAAVFKAAVADRIIPASPCVGTRLPRREPRRVVPPTTEAVWHSSAPSRTVSRRWLSSPPAPVSARARRSA